MSGTKRRSTRRHIPEHLNLQASNRLADIQNFTTPQTGNTVKLKFSEDCCASGMYRKKVTEFIMKLICKFFLHYEKVNLLSTFYN